MSAYEWPLWLLLGAGTSLLFLNMQKWSVEKITPAKPLASQVLVLGGMVLRWVLVALILTLALKRDPLAALITFAAFMLARLVILAIWNRQWRLAAVQTHSKKD